MKTYIENYALAMPKLGNRNRKRHTRLKAFALRLVTSLAIAGLVYFTMKR